MKMQSKVQQRGIQATRTILQKLLEGVPMSEKNPVLVVDCMPNRLLSFHVLHESHSQQKPTHHDCFFARFAPPPRPSL